MLSFGQHDDTRLTAVIQDNPDRLAPKCLYYGFYWSKDKQVSV